MVVDVHDVVYVMVAATAKPAKHNVFLAVMRHGRAAGDGTGVVIPQTTRRAMARHSSANQTANLPTRSTELK